ncbi:unnamed protein product [Nezara viridula]|uniref:Uncharacterized protein n=1 Tax=Nezara viridula TaxID=85310 RepID=A0A9P0HNB2_NEZVI|nr:unnamed protein product [Nezara viridula]
MYQTRSAYIDELNNFLNVSKNSLNNVLNTINWTKQSLLSVKEVGSFQNPVQDVPVADHNISHTIDGTLEGLNNESGGDDHLYNDIVASLLVNDQPIKTDKKDVKTEDKAAALIQLLKMERDAKRRRISYKNKVHTKNKSHTEVLREVLEEQMLTITGVNGDDSAVSANDRLQPSLSQAQELIAIQPPQGNPHLAWLNILEKTEGDKKQSDHQARAQRSGYNSHKRHSPDRKESSRYEEEKERKKHKKDRRRKEEDKVKYREREKKNDLDRNSSPNYEDRHYKKKKRSRSHSSDVSNHHRHKSKHKKKKH